MLRSVLQRGFAVALGRKQADGSKQLVSYTPAVKLSFFFFFSPAEYLARMHFQYFDISFENFFMSSSQRTKAINFVLFMK